MIDFHNHVIPGVDDGAADLDQARAALEAFRAQGVLRVVATPHVRASEVAGAAGRERRLAELDAGWDALCAMAAAELPDLRLERGAELMLDLPDADLSDPRLRLAGTRYVLVEFPFMTVPPHSVDAVFRLKLAGWMPVIAHPERYTNPERALAECAEWRRVGALLQVNAGSVLGRYGAEVRRAAWALLGRGEADFLCSDYHARGTLHLAAARAELEARGGAEQAQLLTEVNPAAMLEGGRTEPVPPLGGRRSLWSRLFGR